MKYMRLDQKGSIMAEYIWIDAFGATRSKSRVSMPRISELFRSGCGGFHCQHRHTRRRCRPCWLVALRSRAGPVRSQGLFQKSGASAADVPDATRQLSNSRAPISTPNDLNDRKLTKSFLDSRGEGLDTRGFADVELRWFLHGPGARRRQRCLLVRHVTCLISPCKC